MPTLRPVFEGLSPPYLTIVADPPWYYDERVVGFDKTIPMPYSTMSVAEIAELPVVDLAAPSAHLYLWTTNRHLWEARDVCRKWGFEPSQVLTWCKPLDRVSPGGGTFFGTTEFIIFARSRCRAVTERVGRVIREAREASGMNQAEMHRIIRGGPPTGIVFKWENDMRIPNERDWVKLQTLFPALRDVARPIIVPPPRVRVNTTWWEWPRGRHSEKPAAFLDVVERVSPYPYVELFARAPRLGWDSWGKGYEAEKASV